MDTILESAWKRQAKPFHEKTLVHENLLPISVLRQVLRSIIDSCEDRYPNHLLYTFDDWHEHDGYITINQVTNFYALYMNMILESDQSLYDSRQGDNFVYKAFYPSTCDFLLRYYMLETEKDDPEYSPGLWENSRSLVTSLMCLK